MTWIAKTAVVFMMLASVVSGALGLKHHKRIKKTKARTAKTVIATSTPAIVKSTVATPAKTWQAGTQWFDIPGPNGTTIKTAVTYPTGQGPFPLIILLHGSEGLRQAYVTISQTFANAGFAVAAPCWFTGFHAPMSNFYDYISCPSSPKFSGANIQAVKVADSVISYVENLPGIKPNDIGLIGSSRGSTLALLTASTENDIKAVVSVSAIYDGTSLNKQQLLQMMSQMGISLTDDYPITMIQSLNSPVLVLAGTGDSVVGVSEAKNYETALKTAGKTYQSYYYDGAPHLILFTDPWGTDVQNRAIQFFKSYL